MATLPTASCWPLSALPTTVLIAILTIYLVLTHRATRKLHPLEPSHIAPRIPIPYLGHLLNLALHGGHHIRTIGLASTEPINTVALPLGACIYIVSGPTLAAALQRRPEAELSFHALLPLVVGRVMGLDGQTREIVRKGVDEEGGGVLGALHAMLAAKLSTGGGGVEALTLRALRELAGELEAFAGGGKDNGEEVHDLLFWVRHLVAPATARLLYGARNPLTHATSDTQQAHLERSFWAFDHGLGRLLMCVVPSITARKAYAGREALVAAFRTYIEAEHYKATSEGDGADDIVLARIRIARAHGFGVDGVARSELSFLFAGIVNTTTTTFWMLARIFADRDLLRAVRSELSDSLIHTGSEKGQRRYLSLRKLLARRASSTLHAVYKEVLRLGSNHSSTRLVREDMLVAVPGEVKREVWLRKGGVVQIAGGAMHANPAFWGADAAVFNPVRHLGGGATRGQAGAFRAFGGGSTVCPGRHFATGEILGLVACVVLRFEMVGEGEDGVIRVPELDDYILPVHILEPVAGGEVKVRIRLREGEKGGRVEIMP